ncbi:hypothetical protein ACFHWD_03740 [Clostridium sp. MT-14]|uniref:hypothetical protein n=1 Tax=Clostridium sp. MT-14 TaxID=3348360 RepID=UPI0035F49E68
MEKDKNINIKELTLEQLKELKIEIEQRIKELESAENKEYEFDFEATNDPRKGTPYVARITEAGGKLQRDFINLNREYGKGDVTVSGSYTAKEDEVLEIRSGGSWKNDYRKMYIVQNGELKSVADCSESADKVKVLNYLQGKITKEQLLRK